MSTSGLVLRLSFNFDERLPVVIDWNRLGQYSLYGMSFRYTVQNISGTELLQSGFILPDRLRPLGFRSTGAGRKSTSPGDWDSQRQGDSSVSPLSPFNHPMTSDGLASLTMRMVG